MLQRKTVNLLKQAGEMGKLERESVLDNDVKARLRWVEWGLSKRFRGRMT